MGKDSQHQKTVCGRGRSFGGITREFSSGGVVFKKEGNQILWLVRKTVASKLYPKTHWMLPKGRIDDKDGDMPGPMASGKVRADEKSLQDAALHEVREEGGVDAKIIDKIGTTKYSFTDPKVGPIFKFVTFYLMEFTKDSPDGFGWETSEVLWLPFSEAVKKLSFSGEKQVLKKANDLLNQVSVA